MLTNYTSGLRIQLIANLTSGIDQYFSTPVVLLTYLSHIREPYRPIVTVTLPCMQ